MDNNDFTVVKKKSKTVFIVGSEYRDGRIKFDFETMVHYFLDKGWVKELKKTKKEFWVEDMREIIKFRLTETGIVEVQFTRKFMKYKEHEQERYRELEETEPNEIAIRVHVLIYGTKVKKMWNPRGIDFFTE